MKLFLFLSSFTILSTLSFANARELNLNKISCTGEAENGAIIINEVSVKQNNVSIMFTLAGLKSTQNYIITERMKNGTTDARNAAYFIGATKSGDKNDYEDMSLPRLGLYKDGLGSEITFNVKGSRVFGTVKCKN